MELKRLHDATLRKEYLSESDLSKYMYAHAADLIELIEAAKMLRDNVSEYVKINNLGDPFHNQDMQRIRSALLPFEKAE